MRAVRCHFPLFSLVLLAGALSSSLAHADTWNCIAKNSKIISSFKINLPKAGQVDGTLMLNPNGQAKPQGSGPQTYDRAFTLQSTPMAVQTPLDGTTLIHGRSDSLDKTQVNLHLVILLQTEFGSSADIYTELGSGQGVFKDALSCQIDRS